MKLEVHAALFLSMKGEADLYSQAPKKKVNLCTILEETNRIDHHRVIGKSPITVKKEKKKRTNKYHFLHVKKVIYSDFLIIYLSLKHLLCSMHLLLSSNVQVKSYRFVMTQQ